MHKQYCTDSERSDHDLIDQLHIISRLKKKPGLLSWLFDLVWYQTLEEALYCFNFTIVTLPPQLICSDAAVNIKFPVVNACKQSQSSHVESKSSI